MTPVSRPVNGCFSTLYLIDSRQTLANLLSDIWGWILWFCVKTISNTSTLECKNWNRLVFRKTCFPSSCRLSTSMERVGTKEKFCVRILIGIKTVASELKEPQLIFSLYFQSVQGYCLVPKVAQAQLHMSAGCRIWDPFPLNLHTLHLLSENYSRIRLHSSTWHFLSLAFSCFYHLKHFSLHCRIISRIQIPKFQSREGKKKKSQSTTMLMINVLFLSHWLFQPQA